MRIGIVSDSHGDVRVFNDMLAVPGVAEVELWLHAGDFAPDADDLELLSGRRVVRVLGNCDLFVDGVYDETVVEVAGHRIFLTHGHLFNVRFDTEMLAEAHVADIADRIETTSNASLLTENICRGLVRGGLDYLRVSIYSAIPEKHLEITDSNVPMQRVHDNLRMLQRVKREMGSERPFIACKMLNTFDEEENRIFRDAYADVADEIYIDEPHSWVEIEGEQFIDRLYGDDIGKVQRQMTGRVTCPMPFTTLAVRSDGAVSPCCNDWYGGTNLSNVQDESLADIWNGWKLYDFQVMQLEKRNRENISCRGCSVYKSAHYTRDDIDDVPVAQLRRPIGEEMHG